MIFPRLVERLYTLIHKLRNSLLWILNIFVILWCVIVYTKFNINQVFYICCCSQHMDQMGAFHMTGKSAVAMFENKGNVITAYLQPLEDAQMPILSQYFNVFPCKKAIIDTANFVSGRPDFFWLSMYIENSCQANTQRPAYGILGHSSLRVRDRDTKV